jgi:hypothetical protein
MAKPLISHMGFLSGSRVISGSHFFHTRLLQNSTFQTIEELAIHIGETLSHENGYEPPAPRNQLSLF